MITDLFTMEKVSSCWRPKGPGLYRIRTIVNRMTWQVEYNPDMEEWWAGSSQGYGPKKTFVHSHTFQTWREAVYFVWNSQFLLADGGRSNCGDPPLSWRLRPEDERDV